MAPLPEVLEVEVGQQQVIGADLVLTPVPGVGQAQLGVPKVGQAEAGQDHQLEVGHDLGQGPGRLLQGEVGHDLVQQLPEVGHDQDPEQVVQGQDQQHHEEVGQDLVQQHQEVGHGRGHQAEVVLRHTHHMAVVEVGQPPRLAAGVGQGQHPLLGQGQGVRRGRPGGAGRVQRVMMKEKAVGMKKSKYK